MTFNLNINDLLRNMTVLYPQILSSRKMKVAEKPTGDRIQGRMPGTCSTMDTWLHP